MDLDDLKERWQAQEPKLDARLRLNPMVIQMATLGRAETALRRLSRLVWIEVLPNGVVLLWLGSFLARHLTEMKYLAPALVLHLFVIGQVGAGVWQLVELHRVDFLDSLVQAQTRLGRLRALRVRLTMGTFLVAPLLWTPLLIVGFKGFLGVNAYAAFPGSWLLGNFLFGVAFILVGFWLARRYAERVGRSPLVQRFLRDLAGTNLVAAEGFLKTLARFESDERS